jgi:hypothetical protein
MGHKCPRVAPPQAGASCGFQAAVRVLRPFKAESAQNAQNKSTLK